MGEKGTAGTFRITSEGTEYARRAKRREVHVPGGLDWKQDVQPVLLAVYTALVEAGSPFGVDQAAINAALGREPDDPHTDRVLYELERWNFIEASAATDATWGPLLARLTEKGLQHTAGWPVAGGHDLADRLVWALEQRIAQAETEDERTKLQRARDAVLGIGRDVLTEVLTNIATQGL